jgi:aminoglycoside phosphotransferase (APT) family kinase protein
VPEWSPEIVVDEPLVRLLLGRQCSRARAASLRLAGEGWDNTAWLVDERWLFRFPRREIALDGVGRELRVLPALAPLLPLPIPQPVFVGRSTSEFPWPFFGSPVVPGRELAEARLSDDARSALARPLGRFLRALHAASIPVELPVDPISRADMGFRVPLARSGSRSCATPIRARMRFSLPDSSCHHRGGSRSYTATCTSGTSSSTTDDCPA